MKIIRKPNHNYLINKGDTIKSNNDVMSNELNWRNLNEEILEIWKKLNQGYYASDLDVIQEPQDKELAKDVINLIKVKTPYLYGVESPNKRIVFLGCNYSDKWTNEIKTQIERFESKKDDSKRLKSGIEQYVKYLKAKLWFSLKPNSIVNDDNTNEVYKAIMVKYQLLCDALKYHPYYTTDSPEIRFLYKVHKDTAQTMISGKEISEIIRGSEIDKSEFTHIDMFFTRLTKEADLKRILKISNKLTMFAQAQIDITIKAIELIKPSVVVVISAFVSEIIQNIIGEKDVKSYYENARIGNHKCNVILGGMVYNWRATDRWTKVRNIENIQLHDCIRTLNK